MPSHPLPDAFVMMYEHDEAPWSWPQWQEITGIKKGLFPADDKDLLADWTRAMANDVQSYFKEFTQRATDELKSIFAKTSHHPGRKIWFDTMNKIWKRCNLHGIIVEGLRENSVHPLDIMSVTKAFPPADQFIPIAASTIAEKLFGEDVFISFDLKLIDNRFSGPITSIIQRSWNTLRVKSKKDRENMSRIREAAVKAINNLDAGMVTQAKISRAMGAVNRWKAIVDIQGTSQDREEAQKMLEQISEIMKLITDDASKSASTVNKEKRMRCTSFRDLATKEEIAELTEIYEEYFQPAQLEDGDDGPALVDTFVAEDLTEEFGKRELGMEEEASLTPEDLVKLLGLKEGLPHQFNKYRNRTGLNPWDQPDAFEEREDSTPSGMTPLQLHWHQLAGIHSIARTFFTAEPTTLLRGILISDEVGLGKTALSIGVIAFLNQLVSLQSRGQSLPPVIEKRPYLGNKLEIESLPHLIVCPGTLRAQWVAELKTLFKPKSVDILEYNGESGFWKQDGVFYLSNQKMHNKIVVMTQSLLVNEMKRIHDCATRNKVQHPWEFPPQKRSPEGTVFFQRFLTVTIDEAHQMRNPGIKHWGTLRVLNQATARLVMTATPLLTSPRDISAMGRLVGVSYFHSKISLELEKDYNAGIRRAKKQEDTLSLQIAQVEAVRKLQGRFHGFILRRTIDSEDWNGQTLLSLPQHKEIIGVLKLTSRETGIIQARAELAKACVMSANERGRFQTKKFYLEYRTAVGYAKEDPDLLFPKFKSLDEWKPLRSTKMDVCAQICQHYLTHDDVPDVTFEDGIPAFNLGQSSDGAYGTPTRRILIYAEFTTMTPLLQNVLELYGISSLSINGKIKFEQRDKIIKRFHDPNQPRVLIFSSVGSAGLNLSIADIVIFFDQPWSAQDERQIRGRAHRQPQQKEVRAIHLLAEESSDLLMNDMARGKQVMFDAFVNKTLGHELRALLSGKALDGDINEEDFQEDIPDKAEKPVKSRKRKNKDHVTDSKGEASDVKKRASNAKRSKKMKDCEEGKNSPKSTSNEVDDPNNDTSSAIQTEKVSKPDKEELIPSDDGPKDKLLGTADSQMDMNKGSSPVSKKPETGKSGSISTEHDKCASHPCDVSDNHDLDMSRWNDLDLQNFSCTNEDSDAQIDFPHSPTPTTTDAQSCGNNEDMELDHEIPSRPLPLSDDDDDDLIVLSPTDSQTDSGSYLGNPPFTQYIKEPKKEKSTKVEAEKAKLKNKAAQHGFGKPNELPSKAEPSSPPEHEKGRRKPINPFSKDRKQDETSSKPGPSTIPLPSEHEKDKKQKKPFGKDRQSIRPINRKPSRLSEMPSMNSLGSLWGKQ